MSEETSKAEERTVAPDSVAAANGGPSEAPKRSPEERESFRSGIFGDMIKGTPAENRPEHDLEGFYYDYEDEDESVDAHAESEEDQATVAEDAEETLEESEEEAEASEEAEIESDEFEDLEEDKVTVLTYGEKEVKIPNDAVFEVVVDGKPQEVTFQEIKNGISGEKALAQRFSALDIEKKQVGEIINDWNNNRGQFMDLMSDGKAVEALNVVFQNAGYSPDVAFASLFEELLPYYSEYAKLSEPDRMAWMEKTRAERHRLQLDAANQQLNQVQAEKEQLIQIRQAQQTYGMDDATFAAMHDALLREMQSGTLPQKEMSAQLVGEYYLLATQESWATQALAAVKPELANDKDAVLQVVTSVRNMTGQGYAITEEDVREVVKEVYGLPAKVNKSKKVAKVLDKKKHPDGKPQPKPKSTKSRSARGPAGKAPKHWMDALANDLSKDSQIERQAALKKWRDKA